MANFVVQFPLKTERYQDDILDKRFEIARHIYNSLVTVTQKRYREMIKTRKYRSLMDLLTGVKKNDKDIWKEINQIRKDYGMSEYAFYNDVKLMQHHFKKNIDAHTAQNIAKSLWVAYDKLFFGNGRKIYYKRYGELNSLASKTNKTGIRFKDNKIYWFGLIIPVIIKDNYYEQECFKNEIVYCRIVRKFVRNKNKYYVQLVFKGIPPVKYDKDTGNTKHSIGNGDVGLDIGTSTIAVSSKSDVKIFELADKVQNIENQKRKLLRKMDRSRRSMNPNNFNEDGTIKKQGNKKVKWVKSNHYLRYQHQLKELHRKQTDIRKYQHECLANYIISLGNKFYVEKMHFSGLQKRAEKTEISEKTGKFKRKKRFGKTLANRSPAMLIGIINRKLGYYGEKLIEIDTFHARASQFNHFDETYTKKKLSQRWNDFHGIKVQRDMYSAFLIMNVNEDLKSFNLDKCNERFDDFFKLHNLEVERLKGHKNLSSIAI